MHWLLTLQETAPCTIIAADMYVYACVTAKDAVFHTMWKMRARAIALGQGHDLKHS